MDGFQNDEPEGEKPDPRVRTIRFHVNKILETSDEALGTEADQWLSEVGGNERVDRPEQEGTFWNDAVQTIFTQPSSSNPILQMNTVYHVHIIPNKVDWFFD